LGPAGAAGVNGHLAGPVGPASPSGLRQRVPGAHLINGGSGTAPGQVSPRPLDADAARDLVEQFEFGVHRAHGEPAAAAVLPAAAPAVLPTERVGEPSSPPEWPPPGQPAHPAPAVTTTAAGPPPTGAPGRPPPGWPAEPGKPPLRAAGPAPTDAVPLYAPRQPAVLPEPTGAGGFHLRPTGTSLNRRVPGATIESSLLAAPIDRPLTAYSQLDPDEVRDLVEQFELGVTEALHHAQTGAHPTEERERR
jgi:hypothetical protein